MKFHRYLLCAILLLFISVMTAQAAGPVWKIRKGERVLYLGGTVHVLSQEDYPLPESFDTAYEQASVLVLETDLDRLNSPEIQQRMLEMLFLPEGKTLRDILAPETFGAVEKFVATRGMSIEQMLKFKPAMLDITLTFGELRRMGLTAPGVDQYFQQHAKADFKKLGALESAETQLEVLANMGTGQEDAMINHTLDEISRLPKIITMMKATWRAGDIAGLAEIGLAPIMEKFPQVYQEMLVKRNRAWLERLDAFLTTPEVELVLVGALHLAGPDGLLEELVARGYAVERL